MECFFFLWQLFVVYNFLKAVLCNLKYDEGGFKTQVLRKTQILEILLINFKHDFGTNNLI